MHRKESMLTQTEQIQIEWIEGPETNRSRCSAPFVRRPDEQIFQTLVRRHDNERQILKKIRRSALSGGYIGTKCSPTHWKHSSNPPQNPKYSIISVRQSLWPTAQLETTKKHLQCMFKKPSNQPRVARGPQAANIHHCCRSVERHTSVRRRTQAPWRHQCQCPSFFSPAMAVSASAAILSFTANKFNGSTIKLVSPPTILSIWTQQKLYTQPKHLRFGWLMQSGSSTTKQPGS